MNRAIIVLASITLAAIGLGFGCGGGDEDLPEPQARPKAERTERAAPPAPVREQAPITAKSGADNAEEGAAQAARQLRETIDLPDFYPEDGPVYPGAKPSKVEQAPNGKVSVIFGTETAPDEAAKIMTEAAEAKGWLIESEDTIERGRLTRAGKSGRSLLILTNRIGEGSQDAMTLVAVSIDP